MGAAETSIQERLAASMAKLNQSIEQLKQIDERSKSTDATLARIAHMQASWETREQVVHVPTTVKRGTQMEELSRSIDASLAAIARLQEGLEHRNSLGRQMEVRSQAVARGAPKVFEEIPGKKSAAATTTQTEATLAWHRQFQPTVAQIACSQLDPFMCADQVCEERDVLAHKEGAAGIVCKLFSAEPLMAWDDDTCDDVLTHVGAWSLFIEHDMSDHQQFQGSIGLLQSGSGHLAFLRYCCLSWDPGLPETNRSMEPSGFQKFIPVCKSTYTATHQWDPRIPVGVFHVHSVGTLKFSMIVGIPLQVMVDPCQHQLVLWICSRNELMDMCWITCILKLRFRLSSDQRQVEQFACSGRKSVDIICSIIFHGVMMDSVHCQSMSVLKLFSCNLLGLALPQGGVVGRLWPGACLLSYHGVVVHMGCQLRRAFKYKIRVRQHKDYMYLLEWMYVRMKNACGSLLMLSQKPPQLILLCYVDTAHTWKLRGIANVGAKFNRYSSNR